MWDDVTEPASHNQANNGVSNSSGGGFYLGRGRGFGNMSSVSKALPEVGNQNSASNGTHTDSGWDDDETGWGQSSKQQNVSNSGSSFGQSNSFGGQQNRESRPSFQNGWSGNSTRSHRDSTCYKCGESGHMSRECPSGGSSRGGGGGGRACHKCNEEGHMARDCPNGGGGGGSRACFKCGEEGHMSRECPSGGGGSRACFKCGEEGHMSRECPNGGGGGGGGGGSRACFKCGEEGHMSRECPSGGGGGGGSRACFKCGEEGHMSRECPTGGGGGGGGGGGRACHKCGEEGHMARECPTGGSGGGDRACFKCKETGHMARECPNEEQQLGEDGKPRPPPYKPPEMAEDEQTLFQYNVPAGINFDKYDNISVDVSGSNPPASIKTFEDSGLCQLLCQNIQRSNYLRPTPVQKYAIPIIMNKRDLMACAQTGSGKTAAFLLPMLHNMIPNGELPNNSGNDCQEPWAVIIAPTRELVMQIGAEAKKFAYDSVAKAEVIYGGTSTGYQSSRIRRGVHILVATPGRLLDFVEKGKVSFSQLKYLVLDEADRMLDMGFAPDIRRMVEHDTMPERGQRQTLMFSATFPEEIQKLASEYLENYLFLTVGMVGAANSDVEQSFFNVGQYDKRAKLLEILQEAGTDRTLVFVELKRNADFIASYTSQNNIPTTSIHGDRMQREREEALRDFRSGKMPVLVATAVAARGLDIKGVKHVINYDLPKTIDEYVHRIGRTGRVGNTGRATSFYDASVDQPLARSLKKILIDALQEVPEWLSEEAAQAFGTSANYGGRDNYRDVRSQGRNNRSSNDAYDNNFDQSSAPSYEAVAEEEAWG